MIYERSSGINTRDAIINFIIEYKTEHGGLCPSYAQICAGCNISSLSMLSYHLERLQDMGRVSRGDGEARNITLPGEVYTPPG